jgi:hypothetical protein
MSEMGIAPATMGGAAAGRGQFSLAALVSWNRDSGQVAGTLHPSRKQNVLRSTSDVVRWTSDVGYSRRSNGSDSATFAV